MGDRRQAALVLRPENASGSEAHTFPGFPGRFVPGAPIAVADLGLTKKQADELVDALNLPLTATTANAYDDDETRFDRTGGLPSDSEAESWPPPSVRAAAEARRSDVPGLTADELTARDGFDEPREAAQKAARDAGVTLPVDVPTSPGDFTDAAASSPAVAAIEAAEADQPEPEKP